MLIEFEITEPYTCPTCGKQVNVRPCPACEARAAASEPKAAQIAADRLMKATAERTARTINQARHDAAQ